MPGETEHYKINKHYKERESIILMAYFTYLKYTNFKGKKIRWRCGKTQKGL